MKIARGLITAATALVLVSGLSSGAIAQQRAPIDGDEADYIADYCDSSYSENFSSVQECTFYVSSHYIPPEKGSGDGGSYFIFLPDGDYVTYHLI